MTDPVTSAGVSSGIETSELDPAVRPQDDLFRHVNGQWIDRTEIPGDKARWGSFMILAEEAESAVRDIIAEAQDAHEGTEERKFGDLFASFMDEERIEKLGTTPIEPQLALASDVDSIPGLLATIGTLERHGLAGFYQLFVDNDPGNPERYLVFVEQAGISLPDECYFREEKFASIREAYVAHIQRMFELAGLDERPRARAARLRPRDRDRVAPLGQREVPRLARRPTTCYSWDDAAALFAGAADRRRRPHACGSRRSALPRAPSPSSCCASRRSPPASPRLLTDDRLESWKDWLAWQIIHGAAPYLLGRFRRGELRLLRPHAHRHAGDARPLEARRLARRGRDGRGRRPHLRRAALPAGGQREHGCAGRQPDRGVPAEHPGPRVDERGHPRPRARQAGEVHAQDRLSR